jgi:hypothetical protein
LIAPEILQSQTLELLYTLSMMLLFRKSMPPFLVHGSMTTKVDTCTLLTQLSPWSDLQWEINSLQLTQKILHLVMLVMEKPSAE